MTYDDVILATPNLVAYWPLDEPVGSTTARELKGGLNGTVNGAVRLGKGGPWESRVAGFGGGGGADYIGVPDHNDLDPGNTFSVEWFMLLRQVAGRDETVWYKGGNAIYITKAGAALQVGKAGVGFCMATGNVLGQGVLEHYVWSNNGATGGALYRNAIDLGLVYTNQSIASSAAQLQIGFSIWGVMSRVSLYSRALTAAEVLEHYNARKLRGTAYTPHPIRSRRG